MTGKGRCIELKKVAVLQSNYIPWKGYFDIIHDVDEFIFYDEVQYTTRDWRNRNKIIIDGKPRWLSVPVGSGRDRKISDVVIADASWQKKHYESLRHAYGRAPHFQDYAELLAHIYLERTWTCLFELNRYIIKTVSRDILGVSTHFSDSRDFVSHGAKHEKLLAIVEAAGADVYISGPAAKEYIKVEDYTENGIAVVWKDYSGYPAYQQASSTFTHNVSILDLLFHVGKKAPYYIWGWRNTSVLGGGTT